MAKKKRNRVADYSTANRGIARKIAYKRMKDAGMVKLCKKQHACCSPFKMSLTNGYVAEGKHRSYFANNWRELVYG